MEERKIRAEKMEKGGLKHSLDPDISEISDNAGSTRQRQSRGAARNEGSHCSVCVCVCVLHLTLIKDGIIFVHEESLLAAVFTRAAREQDNTIFPYLYCLALVNY